MSYNPRACGAKCDECPLRGQPVVPPDINPNALPLLFVSDAPGPQESMKGVTNFGPAGQKLDFLLRQIGPTTPKRSAFRHTHAILCRPDTPGIVGKRRFDIRTYMAWLSRENKQRKKLGHVPLITPFQACFPRLEAEIEATVLEAERTKSNFVIVPTGNFAFGQVTGAMKSSSIMKWRGSVLPVEA